MQEFITPTLKIQLAAWQGAVTMGILATEAYLRLADQQRRFLLNHFHRRDDDVTMAPANPPARRKRGHKTKASPCQGADLKDHYGNRSRDVEVERI